SLRALERFMSKAGKVLGALPSRWPVRGPVTSEFGRRRSPWSGAPEFHSGLDIRARRGTLVKAPAPGTVRFAGRQKDYGLTVVLDHGRGIKTRYGHLSRITVRRGDRVERGQAIAKTGNSGKSTGPHLHYGITVRGKPVNPRAYLWD
ncbi:MAG: M23 family metallopeptidase, partial [Candidatus Methylomirabilia bacterium]